DVELFPLGALAPSPPGGGSDTLASDSRPSHLSPATGGGRSIECRVQTSAPDPGDVIRTVLDERGVGVSGVAEQLELSMRIALHQECDELSGFLRQLVIWPLFRFAALLAAVQPKQHR